MTFITNPFMDVDISVILGQVVEAICVEMEIEVINLQNNVSRAF